MDEQVEQKDIDMKRIEDATAVLMEHFDAVQILATRYDSSEGLTRSVDYGSGNWFTRFGMVKDWIRLKEQVFPPED